MLVLCFYKPSNCLTFDKNIMDVLRAIAVKMHFVHNKHYFAIKGISKLNDIDRP